MYLLNPINVVLLLLHLRLDSVTASANKATLSNLIQRQERTVFSPQSYSIWQYIPDVGGTQARNFTYLAPMLDSNDPNYYPVSFSPIVIKTYGAEVERNATKGKPGHDGGQYGTVGFLQSYLCDPNVWTVVQDLPDWSIDGTGLYGIDIVPTAGYCPDGPCSTQRECTPIYTCLFTNPYLEVCNKQDVYQWGSEFQDCLDTNYPHLDLDNNKLQCPLGFINHTKIAEAVPDPKSLRLEADSYDCGRFPWNLTSESWNGANVSENIQAFIHGGADIYGVWWPGLNFTHQLFLEGLGLQLLENAGLSCNLESPCTFPVSCTSVGSRLNFGRSKPPFPSRWGYYVLVSLENISLQFTNQYQALQTAGTKATLTTFNIDDFYPGPDTKIGFQNFLAGLGGVLAIAGGFFPSPAGPTIGAATTVLNAAGSFLGRAIADQAPNDLQQSLFAPQVQAIYGTLEVAMDSAATLLFNASDLTGDNNQSFNIIDMMANGAFVNQKVLAPLVNLTEFLRIEIVSRSINALWKTPSYNKMWVMYVDLQDGDGSKCKAHTTGPQDSKYCADGGVYYSYNFKETATYQGVLAYPWGADKLGNFGIDFKWVTEASARTYQALRSLKLDPFNFTNSALNQAVINGAVLNGTGGVSSSSGRLPGSWTLPVCNTSTWGDVWNFDYVHQKQFQPALTYPSAGVTKGTKFPPCMCGELGTETAGFAQAAGLGNFKTYYGRCSDDLLKYGFKWPQGVASVNLSFGDIIKRPGS